MRRLAWRSCLAAAAVALAAAWVTAPPHAPRFVRDAQASPPDLAMAGERTTFAAPVRYAYSADCHDRSGACVHWLLVSATGERGWLPGAVDETLFTLSRDGLRAAFLRADDHTYVVTDLRTGRVTPLPVKQDGTVTPVFGAQPPLFSPDGRLLLVRRDHLDKDTEVVLDDPLIVDVAKGTVTRLPGGGEVTGWTSEGVVMRTGAPAYDSPGHLRAVRFTVYSPKGRRIRAYTLPGNVEQGSGPSPSGRLIASRHREVAPGRVVQLGVALFDTATGEHVRTVVPRLPDGWWVSRLVRWEDDDTLVVLARGPSRELTCQVLDLRTGAVRPIGLTGQADYPLQPGELSVVLGSVRQ
ncbi:MAG: hypothetical protein HOY71_29505 [Nonomuraea sp.]|nr:hypothetical protein [Nonomuraea sp.]